MTLDVAPSDPLDNPSHSALTTLVREEVFNVLDPFFGAVGDGVADDQPAIQAAIDLAIAAGGGTVFLPVPSVEYRLTASLVLAAAANVAIRGGAPQGDVHQVQLEWDGANGGEVLVLDRSRDCHFSDFSIQPGTGTIGVGIRIDHLSAPAGPIRSTNDIFERITIGASTTGVRIGNLSTTNNELHTFRDVIIHDAGTYGYFINQSDSKWIRMENGSVSSRTTGIYVNAGSFHSSKQNFSANTTDVFIQTNTDTITIEAPQSENAEKFFDDGGTSGAAHAITIVGGRLDPTGIGVDNIYLRSRKRGPLNLIGCDFADGANIPTWRCVIESTGAGAAAVVHGCVFPNQTPFQQSVDRAAIDFRGCSHWTSAPAAEPFEETTPAQITADQNDYHPTHGPKWRLSTDASRTITGFDGGWVGREITITNVGSFNIVFADASGLSGPFNSILTDTGANITVTPKGAVTFIYDGNSRCWRVKSRT